MCWTKRGTHRTESICTGGGGRVGHSGKEATGEDNTNGGGQESDLGC